MSQASRRHPLSRSLSWVRCETCLRRRFVVVGLNWPICCGHPMETVVVSGVRVNPPLADPPPKGAN